MNRGHEVAELDTADAKEIEKESADAATQYDWAAYRKKAGFETHLIAGILWVLPKVGPLSMVAIKGPSEAAEADYMHSLVSSTTALRHSLTLFTPPAARTLQKASAAAKTDALGPPDPDHPLPNRDLDTGQRGQTRRLSANGCDLRGAFAPPDARPESADSSGDQNGYSGVLLRPQGSDHDQAQAPRLGTGASRSDDAGLNANKHRGQAIPHLRRFESAAGRNQIGNRYLTSGRLVLGTRTG